MPLPVSTDFALLRYVAAAKLSTYLGQFGRRIAGRCVPTVYR